MLKKTIRQVLFPTIKQDSVYAITVLRVIATCLITNTHYNRVYPSEVFAVGGLLGDVLFFAVSGFCFSKRGINKSFGDWYIHRWTRIYPSVVIMSIVFFLSGFWQLPGNGNLNMFDFCSFFILPTRFLFFGAIMILYIPMFFCIKQEDNFQKWVIAWSLFYLVYYFFFLDKKVYAMNDVNNPAILFLYFGAILVGISLARKKAFFSWNLGLIVVCVFICAGLYFGSTVYIRSNSKLYLFQIMVPLSLLALCTMIIVLLLRLEEKMRKIPVPFNRALAFVANATLEIYVVQLIIIDRFHHISFPLNWILITALILVTASVLKIVISYAQSIVSQVLEKRVRR